MAAKLVDMIKKTPRPNPLFKLINMAAISSHVELRAEVFPMLVDMMKEQIPNVSLKPTNMDHYY